MRAVSFVWVPTMERLLSTSGTIFGQQMVEEQLTTAFLSHSNNEYKYMYIPNNYEDIVIKRLLRKISNNSLKLINKSSVLNGREKYNTDIYHSLSSLDDMLFLREKCFEKISPITYTLHCASKPLSVTELYMKMLMLPFRPYDSFICTSNSAKEVVEKQLCMLAEKFKLAFGCDLSYKGRLDVIPLGVDTTIFKPYDKIEMRKKYDIPKTDFVILWLGRFSPFDKGDLIQLFRVVSKLIKVNKTKRITLMLVGSDNAAYPYLNDIRRNIQILGIRDHVKIITDYNIYKRYELFCVADVFTSPIDNVQETFGLTPIEAMACGIPQVVSEWDGYKDSVIQDVTGYKIPTTWYQYDPGIYDVPKGIGYHLKDEGFLYSHYLTAQSVVLDENAYMKAFQTLIDNPDILHRMSENSRRIAESKYEWKKIIACYDVLWDELLEQAKYQQERKREDCLKLDAFRMNYEEAFKTYPTHICRQDITLFLSENGMVLLHELQLLLSNKTLDDIFTEYSIYQNILKKVEQNGKINLFSLANEMNQYSASVVKRCAIMLIKRGYLLAE